MPLTCVLLLDPLILCTKLIGGRGAGDEDEEIMV